MGRKSKPSLDNYSKEEREYCVEQYYLNREKVFPVKRAYWLKYQEQNVLDRDRCPTSEQIWEWVKKHEDRQKSLSALQQQIEQQQLKKQQEQKKLETKNLSGTQWGRKTGENRIIRKESIDLGEEHQEIKWRQRDVKWSGPKPYNEKEKIVVPVKVDPYSYNYNYNYHYYQEPVEEEVKPDKKKMLQEKFEGKVLELVESLDAHGHAARASAFVSLRAELKRRAVDDLLAAHRATLTDHVSRALRRGKDGERKAAAAIAPLLAVQIGEEGTEQFVREVRPALTATATDESASLNTRTECCSSLAVLCYLMDDDVTEIFEVMRMYETIFSGSYLKDDGSVNVTTVEEGACHAAALDSWALLLPLLSRNHALSLLNNQEPSFDRLGELLDSPSHEVRISAGVALAIAYEAMSDDVNSNRALRLKRRVDALLPRLTELARDSDRFRARKDLKIQRATFRDILKYFEEGEAPCTSAHIGGTRVAWSSWSDGAAYAALARSLGGALQMLVPHSPRLREALALSDDLDLSEETDNSTEENDQQDKSRKNKKLQRHLRNKAASKARNSKRNQNRDKRNVALSI